MRYCYNKPTVIRLSVNILIIHKITAGSKDVKCVHTLLIVDILAFVFWWP